MPQSPTLRLSSWARLVGLALLLGFGLLAGGLLSSNTAHAQPAATLTVTDCSGETGPGQIGTVIGSASAGDTIMFSCSGDIPLTSSLTINTNLTIDGSGQNVTLDGQGKVQVLIIKSTVTLKALTIVNGYGPSGTYGGGLDIFGTANITDSTISNSHAVYGGGMEIEGSGTANITDSTISNNSANGNGGGIQSFGTFTLTNSTITNNTVVGEGGGVETATEGTSTISNSTISGNYAVNCCGGGISTYMGTVTITGSIIAGNKAPQGPDCDLESNVNRSYNLESGTDCGFSGNGSKQGVDPLLSPLANNGGPTQTMALQQGSPAIDAIPLSANVCPSTDQRGDPRPDVDTPAEIMCDMGAYESAYSAVDDDLGLTNIPSNITTKATSPQGATVSYPPPTVVDEDSPLPTASCSPSSGSTFAIGTTTVTCTVSDSDDVNSPVSHSFQVVVQDTLPPSLQLPSSPVTANATSPQGAAVTYTVTATDPVYPSNQLTINCMPASGSTFAIGTTTVNCTASDPAGNSTSGSFQVVVVGASGQVTATISLVNSFHLSPSGIQTSFDSQLQAVQADLAGNNTAQACSDLASFINHAQAQSGQHLTVSQANQMIAAAKQIQAVLGC